MQPFDPPLPDDDKKDDSSDPLGLEQAEEKLRKETSSSSDIDGKVTGCELAHLIITVQTSKGAAVSGVSVTALGPDLLNPEESEKEKGTYDCGEVEVGDYKIRVEKAWHLEPDSSKEAPDQDITLKAGDKKTVPFLLDPVEIHMFLDADRDGKADPSHKGMDTWEWGKGKKGAIVLCNNDDDYPDQGLKKYGSDNEDDKVSEGNDRDELAPLEIRRTGPTPPDSWEAKLEILDGLEDKLRIFDGREAGSREILGQSMGNEYELPDLNFKKLEFWMEATQYAKKDWPDGLIRLRFTLENPSGETRQEVGKARVAPWMMLHHGVPAKEVFVVEALEDPKVSDFKPNDKFIEALEKLLPKGVHLNKSVSNYERWPQDVMEIGCSVIPHDAKGTHAINAIIQSAQERELEPEVIYYRDRDLGYGRPAEPDDDFRTSNSLGNLEVTPPCTGSDGKHYPFGRIYYGPNGGKQTFNTDMEAFLRNQVVQKPFGIDTSWLAVGHVDEIITFVPDKRSKSKKPFKALVASPYEAYRILEELRDEHGSAPLLKDRTVDHARTKSALSKNNLVPFGFQRTIDEFLTDGYPYCKRIETAKDLSQFNDLVQDTIDDVIQETFPKEIGYSVPRSVKDIKAAREAVRRAEERAKRAEAEGDEELEKLEGEVKQAKNLWEEEIITVKMLEKAIDEIDTDGRKDIEKKKAHYEKKKKELEERPGLAKKLREKADALAKEEETATSKDAEADVIRIPILFLPQGGNTKQAIALTAGTVNMLVVNGTCVFPIPYGPEVEGVDKFQEDLEKKLAMLGLKGSAIDDWDAYHRMYGEVHCGTNTRREPQAWRWWEFVP